MTEFIGDLDRFIVEPSCAEEKYGMQVIDDLVSQSLMSFSSEEQQPQFSVNITDNDIQSHVYYSNAAPVTRSLTPFGEVLNHADMKEKGSCSKKKKRDDERKEPEKPREVIHVRVKRGQATDRHSLAERLRRQKINEKLKSLQNLVPGCYKTMGMSVVLDVIIQYIKSLQNQIEFLSLKLSLGNSVCDFNELTAMENVVQCGNVLNGTEMERTGTEGYGGLSYFHPAWPLE